MADIISRDNLRIMGLKKLNPFFKIRGMISDDLKRNTNEMTEGFKDRLNPLTCSVCGNFKSKNFAIRISQSAMLWEDVVEPFILGNTIDNKSFFFPIVTTLFFISELTTDRHF